jgi:hypothetical protein
MGVGLQRFRELQQRQASKEEKELKEQSLQPETERENVFDPFVRLLSPDHTSGPRDFLSRPLGQKGNPDAWSAWSSFMGWLFNEHPLRFQAICEAEEVIRALEQQGITGGAEYEQACAELFWRFEEARRLKLREGFKVWLQ